MRPLKTTWAGLFGFPPPVQFFITARPHDLGVSWLGDLTAGIGLQNLFGFARAIQRMDLSNRNYGSELAAPEYQTDLAYRFSDWLALGLGRGYFYLLGQCRGGAEQKFISPGLPGIAAGDHVKITGTGTTAGFNTSALITFLRTENGAPRVNLGFGVPQPIRSST